MSPYPTRIDHETVVEKAREMIEAEGVDHLSLHKLAAALGVKAPSLYRYFDGKSALLRAVHLKTSEQLTAATLDAADTTGDAETRLLAMAYACRRFAHENPMTYLLAVTNSPPENRADDQQVESLVLPIQDVMAEISGEERSLEALRGAWALIHGFVMLELNGQFRRAGDVEAAFRHSMEAYLAGWALRSKS